jgi:hypothetical protein
VDHEGGAFIIKGKDERICVRDGLCAYWGAERVAISHFRPADTSGRGIYFGGGPGELIVEQGRATLRTLGEKGLRRIRLPGRWQLKEGEAPKPPIRFREGEWVLDYQVDEPLTVVLERVAE